MLLFIDGFDHYISADIAKKWNANTGSMTINTIGGRRSGGAIERTSTSARNVSKTITASSLVVCGVAVKTSALWATPRSFLWYSDAGTVQVSVRLNADGTLSVMRGSSAGTVLSTSTTALSTSTFYYVEFKADFVTGDYDLRVDGLSWTSGAAADLTMTANASANQVAIGSDGTVTSSTTTFDDLYILNGVVDSDGVGAITFLGDCRIDTLYPNADGVNTAWTASTGGTHYSCVDETAPNTTDYVSSNTVGQVDTYSVNDLTTAGDVYGVQINAAAWKSDSGVRSIQTVWRSGGVEWESASLSLSTSQTIQSAILEHDPATLFAPWSQASINAAEFGQLVSV